MLDDRDNLCTEEKVIVMMAWAKGKPVQFRYRHSIRGKEIHWDDLSKDGNPSWDWYTFDYRVKPDKAVSDIVWGWWQRHGSGQVEFHATSNIDTANRWKREKKILFEFKRIGEAYETNHLPIQDGESKCESSMCCASARTGETSEAERQLSPIPSAPYC